MYEHRQVLRNKKEKEIEQALKLLRDKDFIEQTQ